MFRIYTIPTEFTEEQIGINYQGDMTMLNTLIGASLAQEPDATGSGRGPLTRWMYYWGNPKATKAEAMQTLGVTSPNFVANLEPGDPNPFFTFIDSLNQSGNNVQRNGSVAVMQTVNNDDLKWIDVNRILLLNSAGGYVEGLQVFFVVPEADYETGVPEGLPFDTIAEGEPEELVTRSRKWSEWKSPNHEHFLIEGNYYIPSTSWGVHLQSSLWCPLVLAGELEVVMNMPIVNEEIV